MFESELPATADVAIIGGGFAGVATAWWLARRGVGNVIVLEREAELGRHASGRSAGLGRQLADDDATSALTVRGAAFLRRPPAAFTADARAPIWTPTGGVLSFDAVADAGIYTERARRFELAVEPLDRDQLRTRWPSLRGLAPAAALLIPSDGVIEVGALLAAFVAGAVRGGAQFARATDVRALEPITGGGVRIATGRGALIARVVVDAGGAWAGGLTRDPALTALKRHVFVLATDAPAGDAAHPHVPYVWHLGGNELYVRGDRGGAGGVLASPCDATPSAALDAQLDPSGEARLRALLTPVSPELAAADVTRAWACLRSFTPDRRMRLGRDPRRAWLVWAAGLGGHGATASAAVGEIVANAVIDALA